MPTSATRKADQYDATFRKQRAHWKRRIDRGETIPCWRCGGPIDKTIPWDTGHNETTGEIEGPEHRHAQSDPHCPGNRGEAATRGNQQRNTPRLPTGTPSRTW